MELAVIVVALVVVVAQVWWARKVLRLLSAIAHSTQEGRDYLRALDEPKLPEGFSIKAPPAPEGPRRTPRTR